MDASYAINDFTHRPRHGRHLKHALRAMSAERGRGRGRHRGGPGGNFPFMMGFGGPPFGHGGPFGRGPKARRGDVRTAALLLLNEGPRNGYQIMQEIEERSDGVWRPSPGSIYPVLQQLEDEGLVRTVETDGRKQYELTDAGHKVVSERDADATAPWDQMSSTMSDDTMETANAMRGVGLAFMQVMHAGNEAQIAEAGKVLAEARRRLYGILAEDPPAEESA
jgi:DNA-binding PadR family transcriptional regulator